MYVTDKNNILRSLILHKKKNSNYFIIFSTVAQISLQIYLHKGSKENYLLVHQYTAPAAWTFPLAEC